MAPSQTTEPTVSASGPDPCLDFNAMQTRLALLGFVVFFIALAFFVVNWAIFLLWIGVPSAALFTLPTAAHLAAALTMGLLWLACWRFRLPAGALRAIEAASMIVCCAFWALMTSPTSEESERYVLLALSMTVIARAIIVPSTARRTLWLSAVACVPTPVAAYLILPAQAMLAASPAEMRVVHLISAAMWSGAAIATATVASRVIYGLAREVAAARDIGQYTLEEKLGSGGMGEVWRAHHRMLIRPAAIKIIRPQALGSSPAGPEVMLRRFEREARATAALKSPHTVQLYDFGTADDGSLYYVMELLEGLDLETLVRRFGPVPAERAVHILRHACRSLSEAHAAGLVHRDIKPANLFLIRAGIEHDFVKVLDFGLVKLGQARDGRDAVKLTGTDAMAGTPAYMSPEIVLGDAAVDGRADLYSLGCVGYWLLTGGMVFEGDTPMKMLLDHAHTAPPPPSTRTELAISPELDRVILDCLAKDPAGRPQTAGELSARLEACPTPARWTAERAEKWWTAHLPEPARARRLSDVLLSQEVRPPVLQVRPQTRRLRP